MIAGLRKALIGLIPVIHMPHVTYLTPVFIHAQGSTFIDHLPQRRLCIGPCSPIVSVSKTSHITCSYQGEHCSPYAGIATLKTSSEVLPQQG